MKTNATGLCFTCCTPDGVVPYAYAWGVNNKCNKCNKCNINKDIKGLGVLHFVLHSRSNQQSATGRWSS